jgi:hypothetical protein
MPNVMHDLLIQVAAYACVMLLAIGFIAFLFRGFFWKYLKVKASRGAKLLVHVKTPLSHYFEIGWIEEGFLKYKHHKDIMALCLNKDKQQIYRSLGVNWIKVDEEKNTIFSDEISATGFDSKKFSDLMVRCLQKPVQTTGLEKLIILILIVIGLIAILSCYLGYMDYKLGMQNKATLAIVLEALKESIKSKGVV